MTTEAVFLLPVKIGSVELRNPFVVASGPTAKRVEQLELAERCGWGAASLKHTFNPAPYLNSQPRYRWLKKQKLHTFTAEYRLDMESGLRLVDAARKRTRDLVIIANYSSVTGGVEGWQDAARRFEAAGAHILELNLCCPNMSFNVDRSTTGGGQGRPGSGGATMGQDEDSVRLVVQKTREASTLPIIAKITPEGGRIAEVSRAALEAGASAVCSVANRLGIPPSISGITESRYTASSKGTPWGAFPALGSSPSHSGTSLRSVDSLGQDRTSTGPGG